jgi:hypothetical protein
MRQLGRFLRLERARKDCEQEVVPPSRRFSSLERPGSPPLAPHSSLTPQRFASEPPPPLELQAPDAEQPFIRCPRCGADSIRHSLRCRQCEAALDSEEVRAFNHRLWAETTAARERESQEAHHREAIRRHDVESEQRGLGEALAAEVAAREQARLVLEERSVWGARTWPQRPFGTPLLWRLPAVVVVLGLLIAASRRGAVGVWVALLVLVAVFLFIGLHRSR